MQKLIDSISGIDLTAVQPEQLCRKHGTFRCNSTGSGRDKKYSYRHGASTPTVSYTHLTLPTILLV